MKYQYTLILIFFGIFASAGNSLAAPSVSGVSGTLNHGNSITITGMGFGTKTTAAPLLWDDGSGVNVGDAPTAKGWTGGVPSYTGAYSAYSSSSMQYRAPGFRGTSAPNSHVSHYLGGAIMGYDYGGFFGANGMLWKDLTVSSPQNIYVSFYTRRDPAWERGNEDNYKEFNYCSAGLPYTLPESLVLVTFAGNQWASYQPLSKDGGGSIWGSDSANDYSGWAKRELILHTETSNGYATVIENGIQKDTWMGDLTKGPDEYGQLINMTGTGRVFSIGGYQRPDVDWTESPYPDNFKYFAGIYLDTSFARILIGNAATLTGSTTFRELQIPSAWADTSITATINQGGFSNGATAYLYVFDSTGTANATGYPITFGSGSSDTTPPAMPSGLSVS